MMTKEILTSAGDRFVHTIGDGGSAGTMSST